MTLLHGDNLALLATLPSNSIDAVVTDPPYGLGEAPDALAMLRDWLETGHHDVKSKRGFMGKTWDNFVPQPRVWREVFRVLKPGGHVLAFAGTRTQDLMSLGLRLAGFEIRDLVAWVYGSGFPKSLDVGKALDKMAGAERERGKARGAIGTNKSRVAQGYRPNEVAQSYDSGPPVTAAAAEWDGWGTALKPALEPITLARKPLEGTVAANVLKWHTGAINVDGCRVGNFQNTTPSGVDRRNAALAEAGYRPGEYQMGEKTPDTPAGRWPANLIHDGSDEVVGLFPDSKGQIAPSRSDGAPMGNAIYRAMKHGTKSMTPRDDGGNKSAARFFYCAKVSPSERNAGLDNIEIVTVGCSAWEKEDQKARLRVDMAQSPPRVTDVSGAPNNDASAWSTMLFGNSTTDPSLLAGKYTIETKTSSTIKSKTLSWLIPLLTRDGTERVGKDEEVGGNHAVSAGPSITLTTTTSETTESILGVANAASKMRLTISGSAGSPCDHPTVKPIALMRYLCRLITPPGGTVLDPWMGSGSTGVACKEEGFQFLGMEQDEGYYAIACARCGIEVQQRSVLEDCGV